MVDRPMQWREITANIQYVRIQKQDIAYTVTENSEKGQLVLKVIMLMQL